MHTRTQTHTELRAKIHRGKQTQGQTDAGERLEKSFNTRTQQAARHPGGGGKARVKHALEGSHIKKVFIMRAALMTTHRSRGRNAR